MANPTKRLDSNAPGDFFVDTSCIDCGTCRWIAPDLFGRDGAFATVTAQPTAERTGRALTAVVACPVGAIGTGPDHNIKAAMAALPEIHPGTDPADGVHYVGYHAKKSFGAASWLIRRKGGNILIDSPRLTPALLDRLTELGGVDFLFLTHRDDVAEHARLADHFGLTRIMHQADIRPDTAGVEMPLTGTDPIPLGKDLTVIPTPGHTEGSACLLYQNRYLFTGDHLAFSADGHRLIAFDRHCWHDWRIQTASMARLKDYPFEWILPGHGAPGHLPLDRMKPALDTLVNWMATR